MSISKNLTEIKSKLSTLDHDSSLSYLKELLQTTQSTEDLKILSSLFKAQGDSEASSGIDSPLATSKSPPSDPLPVSKDLELDSFTSLLKSSTLQEGSLWHIISKNWLSSWESHLKLGSPSPGAISNKDLLENDDLLADPRPSKASTNLTLKAGLQEKVHFEVVPKAAYNFLRSRYGEDDSVLKRWCISLADDGSGLHVEVRLKPLNLVILPCQQEKPFKVLISRIETLSQLKQKVILARPELSKKDFRTWVLRGSNHFSQLKSNRKTDVKGKLLLNAKLMIEDCEIAENDLVVAEFKFNDDWLLFNSEQLCAFCRNSGNLRKCTGCGNTKYCSRTCQVNDYKSHKGLCWKIEKKEGLGLVGFQNLGFTCFMNSALQCVMHSPGMKNYFLSGLFQTHLNLDNPLGTKDAELAKVFAKLTQVYWSGEETVIAPWSLKKVISKFSPQFIGYDQHDAHELLTFLLSGIHEDLNQVLVKPYVERPEVEGIPDEQASKNSWKWFLLRNKSFVVDLMYGQLKSTLKCPKCVKKSVTFDPFLTLSVNIPNNRRISFKVLMVNRKLEVTKQKFLVFANTTVGKVKNLMKKKFKVSNLLLFFYYKEKVQGFCEDNLEIADFLQKKMIAYETPDDLKGASIVSVHLMILENGIKKESGFVRLLFFHKKDSLKKIHKFLKTHLPPGFKVFFINPAQFSGFFNKTKPPCVFCGSSSCETCPLPNSIISLEEINEKIGSDSRLDLQVFYENRSNCLKIVEIRETEEISDVFIMDDNFGLNHCIAFTMNPETLDSENEWFCSGCKENVQAQKTLQIYMLPKVLVVHFVRFRTRGVFSSKNTDFIEFPLNDFDFPLNDSEISSEAGKNLGKYDLFGVVNHYGGLGGGHYTAFVLVEKVWYCMDDSSVTQISHDKVVSPAAYILFYKLKSLDA
jgi:ubiquitin carboxyl-terminal hydrolase 4/11/15